MYVATELLGVAADLLIAYLFLRDTFASHKAKPWIVLICYFCLGIVMSFLSFAQDMSFIRVALYAMGIFTISTVCCKARPLQAIYAAIAICGLAMVTDVLLFLLLTALHIDSAAIMSHSNARAVYVMISHIALLLLVVLLLTITHRKRSAITVPFVLMLSPGCIASIFLGGTFCRQVQIGGDDLPLPFFFASVALLYMNLIMVFYAEKMKESTDKQKEQALAHKHYEMQAQYYESLRSEQDKTRAMFHDINKYMLAMQALAGKENTKESQEVLSQAQELYQEIGNVVDVGNSVVSAILSYYKQQLDKEQISFDFDVSVPPEIALSAVEAYILIGNTLDNAIEACALLPSDQRFIKLQFKQFHDILFYQIENSFDAACQNKKKGNQHGYGLKSVESVACNHKGIVSKEIKASIFVLTVRMSS